MKANTYEYEVVLRVLHTEPPNPDEPSFNVEAWSRAAVALIEQDEDLSMDREVLVNRCRLVGMRR